MKKIYRLKKNWEFNEILNSKKQLLNRFVIIYYKESNNFKIGITVPKKFANSVGRNLYKRQLRAIIHDLNIYDYKYEFVIIARKDFVEEDFATKQKEINKLFEKFRKHANISKF
ncbi:ribonuclease P protein component [Mycoplasmopsis gallinacea]|uniref:Ribonuclease P protein component n=1 Tax=Mycoplasmopsis gallinacea TaxID=29556 RepID=A0A449A323_9BACT|nr:ribonuclease P protein component [Mycoplasmopsis gallinacea]VEU58628.1 ribonuclease P protein component [Mycoplasmopsis gallinacea]